MVDRAQNLTRPELRYQIVSGPQDLAQLEDGNLPDGARALMLQPDPVAVPYNASGNREFVFTRLDLPAANPVTFIPNAGYSATPTQNAYLSKSGNLWVQSPQIYLVTLNGVTPVVLSNVLTILGSTGPQALANFTWHRTGITTAVGQVLITPGDNQLSIVSDNANDDGNIMIQYNAEYVYS